MDITHRSAGDIAALRGLLFECAEGCGRRLGVDRGAVALTVIDKGDQFARHAGANGEVGSVAGRDQPALNARGRAASPRQGMRPARCDELIS